MIWCVRAVVCLCQVLIHRVRYNLREHEMKSKNKKRIVVEWHGEKKGVERRKKDKVCAIYIWLCNRYKWWWCWHKWVTGQTIFVISKDNNIIIIIIIIVSWLSLTPIDYGRTAYSRTTTVNVRWHFQNYVGFCYSTMFILCLCCGLFVAYILDASHSNMKAMRISVRDENGFQ